MNKTLLEIISKCLGAVALALFTLAIDLMRDMAKDITDIKTRITRLETVIRLEHR